MAERRAQPRRERGFTLLELLIVLVIFGMVVTGLTSGVRFAGRAWSTQRNDVERGGDLDAVQNVLREIIESGRNFQGNAGTLKFRGPLPRALGQAGTFDLTLMPVDDRLVLSWQPPVKNPPPSDQNQADLVAGVSGFTVAYLNGPEQGPGAPIWGNSPGNIAKPPLLIRISIDFTDNRVWSPLTVAPAIEIVSRK